MTTTTSGGPTQENPAQRGRFESDDNHMYFPATTTTSLMSKCEPEVVLFSCFNTSATTTSLASNQARDGGGFFQLFQHLCHHHLPRIQPNASWRCFQPLCHHHHLPHIQMRVGGGFLWSFLVPTCLPPPPPRPNASQRWFFSVVSTCPPPPPPPSHPNASWRWFFGGSNASATTTTSLASQCELEVVFLVVSTHLPPPTSHPNVSQRWTCGVFRCRGYPSRGINKDGAV
jgi:hypothetical protein